MSRPDPHRLDDPRRILVASQPKAGALEVVEERLGVAAVLTRGSL